MGVTVLGVLWIGLPLAHAVLLRDLPLHGGALLIDVLVGTFVTDTAAYATGRLFGHHRSRPDLSPNKTLEGLIGGFVIGTLGFWFAGLYQDWLTGHRRADHGRRRRRDWRRSATSSSRWSSATSAARTPARCSAPTAACSTASTRSSSRSSPATTWRCSSSTEGGRSDLAGLGLRRRRSYTHAHEEGPDPRLHRLDRHPGAGDRRRSEELPVVGLAAATGWETRRSSRRASTGCRAVALADADAAAAGPVCLERRRCSPARRGSPS